MSWKLPFNTVSQQKIFQHLNDTLPNWNAIISITSRFFSSHRFDSDSDIYWRLFFLSLYRKEIGESKNKYQLLGLNLLFLLSQNRVSEFHTELELLPQEIIQANEFIRHPLALEQHLMEGSYNKIFRAKGHGPSQSYNVFMDILLDTVRNEIGACLESSYDQISVKEAQKRLNFKNEKEVIAFGKKRNWTLSADNVYTFASKTDKPKEPLPSVELAEQAISYARELEMIV